MAAFFFGEKHGFKWQKGAAMPVNTINTAAAVNISAIGIAGTFFGMPIEALVLGAVGGAVALGRSEPSGRRQAVSGLIASMMLAGTLSPLLVELGTNYLHLSDTALLKAFVPFTVGATWQWFTPKITALIEAWYLKIFNKIKGDKQ